MTAGGRFFWFGVRGWSLVDGIPMSALVSEAARARAVVVALHGGAVTSGYFDSSAAPRLSLLAVGAALGFTVIALDRPGYGASAPYAERMATVASRVDLAYATIESFLAGRPRGAGVFLMGHSMGCVLVLQMAAGSRGQDLLGLEIAGIGLRPHAEADTFMGPLTRGERGRPAGRASGGASTGGSGDALWTPPHLYPAGAAGALALSPSPGTRATTCAAGSARFRRWPRGSVFPCTTASAITSGCGARVRRPSPRSRRCSPRRRG